MKRGMGKYLKLWGTESTGWKQVLPVVILTLLFGPMKVSALQFAANVHKDSVELIQGDMQWLSRLNLIREDAELMRIMNLPGVDYSALDAWFSARVKYIIDDNQALDGSTIRVLDHSEQKIALKINNGTRNNSNLTATNIGTGLYISGKKTNSFLGLDLSGIGLIPVTSPRVGIIKIHKGFTMPIDLQPRKSAQAAVLDVVHKVYRISTLFHEARHSDGNGSSLGFSHANCPRGHDYAGIPACDTAANGPYRVGAMITDLLEKSCSECTVAQREALLLVKADYLNRILSPLTPTMVETARNQNQAVCIVLRRAGKTSPECEKILTQAPVEWDDRPEGAL